MFGALVEPLGVPARGHGPVTYVGGFTAQWERGVTNLRYVGRPFLLALIRAKVGDGLTELGCHPGRVDADLRSSYRHERQAELATLTGPGLQAAHGAYWAILDADDVMTPDRLARQVEHLRRHPAHGLVLGLTEAFVTPGEPRPPHYDPAWDHGPYPGTRA